MKRFFKILAAALAMALFVTGFSACQSGEVQPDAATTGSPVATTEAAVQRPASMADFVGMTIGALGKVCGTDYEVSDGGLVPDEDSAQKAIYYADGRLPFSFLTEAEADERIEDAVCTAVTFNRDTSAAQAGYAVDGTVRTDTVFSELKDETDGTLFETTTFGPDGYEYVYEAADGVFAVFRYYEMLPDGDTVADMVEVTSDPYGLYA